jgi:hypothetical protein
VAGPANIGFASARYTVQCAAAIAFADAIAAGATARFVGALAAFAAVPRIALATLGAVAHGAAAR